MSDPWLNISFPERLFVIGAGPSLEILYEYRREANEWGDWAVLRADLVQPLLEFIKPKYTIRYYAAVRHLNKTYGIPLEEVHPDTNGDGQSGGSSLHEFIYQFQDHGGKELFLFGFDGDDSGHWRGTGKYVFPGTNETLPWPYMGEAPSDWPSGKDSPHVQDADHMNKCSSQISIKLFHIGKTRHKTMKQITIDELKGSYLNA